MKITMATMEKLHIFVIFILVIILMGTSFFLYYGITKEKKFAFKARMDYYNSMVKSEQKWLASLQQSNGALAFRGKENGIVSIIPYFSSITAIALLKAPNQEYAKVVQDYFEWHFAHLNDAESDKYGVTGTIYNYSAEVLNRVVKSEKTEQEYDSVDSYAAIFLIALWEYYEKTGNKDYLIAHYQQISDVVGAMNATIDNDGLSYTKPDKRVKYLMDNAEVYQGLSCSVNLFERVFLPHYDEGTSEYSDAKQTLSHLQESKNRQEQEYHTKFWNEAEQRYEIGINNTGSALRFTGWTEFYPDAVAQLFPILFGLLDQDSERARNLYNKFGENFEWEKMAHYEQGDASFYWGLTAYCGALMRDEEKTRAYLDYYISKVVPDYEYPAYNADVAWVVMASAEMARFYQEQMHKIDPLGIVSVQ